MSQPSITFPEISPLPAGTVRPFWSVAIPAYNRPDYLAQCLESVLAYDMGAEQMQILVVDDCSPNSLEPIVQQIGKGRVEYYRNPKNLRAVGTFNTCVELSRGQWIHLLHDDDWVLAGFYSRLRRSLENQPASVGAACCRYVNTDGAGNWVWQPKPFRPTPGILDNWVASIGISNSLNPPAVVIRRSVYEHLGGYHPDFTYTTDWELYKRVASFYDWWYEPDTLVCYRQHENNGTRQHLLTAEQAVHLRRAIEVSETYLPVAIRAEVTTQARQRSAAMTLTIAQRFLREGAPSIALRQIQEALRLSSDLMIVEALFSEVLMMPEAQPIRELLVEQLLQPDSNVTAEQSA